MAHYQLGGFIGAMYLVDRVGLGPPDKGYALFAVIGIFVILGLGNWGSLRSIEKRLEQDASLEEDVEEIV